MYFADMGAKRCKISLSVDFSSSSCLTYKFKFSRWYGKNAKEQFLIR